MWKKGPQANGRPFEALIEKSGALHENLLGMSDLNTFESFTVSKDKLVLRGR